MPGSAARIARMAGTTRAVSSSARDGGVPGPRGLAADVEDVRAGLGHRGGEGHGRGDRIPRATAVAPSRPSPENESGVTFRIPIT